MNLNLRPKEECMYDAVSLGEVMLRLDPGEGRILTARSFRAWEGGGEYNVIRGLRKCFGMKTAVLTALADNEVGKLLEDLMMQGGVDTSHIFWKKTDGIGRICRNGLNFTERERAAPTVRTQRSPRLSRKISISNTSSEHSASAGFIQAASTLLSPSRPVRQSSQRSRQPRSTARSYLTT